MYFYIKYHHLSDIDGRIIWFYVDKSSLFLLGYLLDLGIYLFLNLEEIIVVNILIFLISIWIEQDFQRYPVNIFKNNWLRVQIVDVKECYDFRMV